MISDDTLVHTALGLAGLWMIIGILFKRGGIDARFTIDGFAYVATVASALKAVLAAFGLASPPSGSDLILICGALTAVVLVSVQGLNESFSRGDGVSLVGRIIPDHVAAALPDFALRILGIQGRLIAGSDVRPEDQNQQ